MKKPVKIVLGILVALVLGSGIGVGSAVLAYDRIASLRSINNGAWQTSLAAGSEEASLYLRASISEHGLLALNQSETIYYSATKDDAGNELNGNYTYKIEGKSPDARWWSITAYSADDFLIPNELNRYAYSGNSVAYDKDSKFTIYLSKTQQAGNWLPLGNQKKFALSLRLYNPGESVRKDPAKVDLPHITREVGK
jgi:hypothetical protein